METKCILWTKATDGNGYGKLYRNGRFWKASRWEWINKIGPIPAGMNVLHRCDNPLCYNIDHLFLGTQADNIRDCVAKGRWGYRRARIPQKGSNHGAAKLTEDEVIKIKTLLKQGRTHQSLANDFGVCREMITRINNRKAWTHV